MMRGAWAGIAAALLLTGCASAPEPVSIDTVVLLPHADGTTGAVVMKQGAKEALLDSPYASATSGANGVPQMGKLEESAVRSKFAAALAATPPAPVSFTVYFVSGSDELTDESKANIKLVLSEMARRPSPEITAIGHTDRIGTDQVNDVLSLQRAQRVKELLIQSGIAAARISVAGRGEREPIVPTADEVSEPRNRRVEVSVR
jgi:outer membrane protein OmpA-like peptidoglycan-associated protein